MIESIVFFVLFLILSRQFTSASPAPQNIAQGLGSAFGAAVGSFTREAFGASQLILMLKVFVKHLILIQ